MDRVGFGRSTLGGAAQRGAGDYLVIHVAGSAREEIEVRVIEGVEHFSAQSIVVIQP